MISVSRDGFKASCTSWLLCDSPFYNCPGSDIPCELSRAVTVSIFLFALDVKGHAFRPCSIKSDSNGVFHRRFLSHGEGFSFFVGCKCFMVERCWILLNACFFQKRFLRQSWCFILCPITVFYAYWFGMLNKLYYYNKNPLDHDTWPSLFVTGFTSPIFLWKIF